MGKKDFKSGLDGLINSSIPTDQKIAFKDGSQHSELVKATYLFEASMLEDIKAIAFFSRKSIGKVLAEAMQQYINNYTNLKEAKTIFENK